MSDQSKIDIVLINPLTDWGKEFGVLSSAGAHRPPLNLLNIAAVLLENEYSVKIIDGALLRGGVQTLIDAIVEIKPKYIGMTAMTSHIHACGDLASQLKRYLNKVPVIIGGIHISTLPYETMKNFPSFDIGVVGEGELTIIELLEALDSKRPITGITGLALRKGSRVFLTPPRQLIKNLDTLPLPAWHLIPNYVQTYQPTMTRKTRTPSAYIVTSRGCPFECSFCNNVIHGRSFRSYSVDYLMKIIDHLIVEYKIKDLTIYDENLAFARKRIVDFCNKLIERNYDLTWSCDARADNVDDGILQLMYRAGCRSIWFGMESGDEQMLAKYNKKITKEKLAKAVELTRKNKIKSSGSFIIAGPGDTVASIKNTIHFAKKIGLDYFVPFYYTPIPGTPDYPSIRQHGTVDLQYTSATMTQPTFAPHGMTFRTVKYWYLRSTISFYMQPRILRNQIKDMGPLYFFRVSTSFLSRSLRMLIARSSYYIKKESD
ncbi:MAG: B12-binding domain-containing radical SAM protein [Oligoflexia bacterium]|nr:B12-binding domain-containing radical SAM protein [Oligoflexia bacterium]